MPSRLRHAIFVAALLLLNGCATRPINAPIAEADNAAGYRYMTREHYFKDKEDLVILAFSGGGTRAAAFSYGVLETLRDTGVIDAKGNKLRLLDYVDMITGVSGGSFTALAYGLYGDRLFDDYEQRFLKRNVEGELLARLFSPLYWGPLSSTGWGRSELAAQLYDEILFNKATYADLQKGSGALIVVSATDLSTGGRFYFLQSMFDALCSDVASVPLSRAAASSSAVPVVLSPVTINNYGGTCRYSEPPLLKLITDPDHPARPAARAIQRWKELQSYGSGAQRPYVHLVDGGVSDNVGMRGVLEALDDLEALHLLHQKTPLDRVRRIIVYVVNSLSSPETTWGTSENAPGSFAVLLRATGVPIDHYSYEAVELMKDTAAHWAGLRAIRDSGALTNNGNPALVEVTTVPNAEIYVIDVSFPALKDKAERDYLNNLPTSFVLPAEAVDRLRAAAKKIILESPEFQRLLNDMGERIVKPPVNAPSSSGAS